MGGIGDALAGIGRANQQIVGTVTGTNPSLMVPNLVSTIATASMQALTVTMGQGLGGALTSMLGASGIGEALANSWLAQAKLAVHNGLKEFNKEQTKAWDKVDQAAFDISKQLGMSSKAAENLRNNMIDLTNAGVKFGAVYGKTLDQVIKMQGDFSTAVGRQISLTNSQLEDLAALGKVVGDETAVKMTAGLEKFGLSVNESSKIMADMYNESLKKGISLQAYSKNVVDNLHLAQQYAFKDGVQGLKSMAELSAKVSLDMKEAFKLADKVNTVEGAVNTAAQLQVLGGPFANFADPMALLHGSLKDVPKLFENLTSLVSKFGTFDENKKEFQVNDFDKIRLKQAAQAMGVDYGELIKSANRQAQISAVEEQLKGLTNIPKEYHELIKNTAQFENGIAGIRGADGSFTRLAQLNPADITMLAENSKSDSENIRDIAKMMRGALEIEAGVELQKENEHAAMYSKRAEQIKNIRDNLGQSTSYLQELVKLETSAKAWQTTVMPMFAMFQSLLRPIGSLFMMGRMMRFEKGGLIQTHSAGGPITNGTPGVEHPLVTAQNGEYVINAASYAKHASLVEAINKDKIGNLKISTHSDGGVIDDTSLLDSSASWMKESGVLDYTMRSLPSIMTLSMINSFRSRGGRAGLGAMMMGMDPMTMMMMGGGGMNGGGKQAQRQMMRQIYSNLNAINGNNISSQPMKVEFTPSAEMKAQMNRVESQRQKVVDYQTRKGVSNRQTKVKSANNLLNKYEAELARMSVREQAAFEQRQMQQTQRNPSAHWEQKKQNILNKRARRANVGKIAGTAAMGLAGGIMGGMQAWNQAEMEYEMDGTAIMDTGKAQGGKIGAAAGAAITTGLLSCIPFVGPVVGPLLGPAIGGAIGQAIGESVGAIDPEESLEYYNEMYQNMSGKAKDIFVQIDPTKFNKDELKALSLASFDGNITENEISKELAEKLQQTNNGNLIKKYHTGSNGPLSPSLADSQGEIKAKLTPYETVLNPIEAAHYEYYKQGILKNSYYEGGKVQHGGNVTHNHNYTGSITLTSGNSNVAFDVAAYKRENPIGFQQLTRDIMEQMAKDNEQGKNYRDNPQNRYNR